MNRKKLFIFLFLLALLFAFPANTSLRSSDNYKLQTDASGQGGGKASSESYTVRQGSAGQGTAGKSDSNNYSGNQGYIYTINTKPNSPESLAQYKANGTTQIPWPAGWTSTSSEVMKMNISDPDPGDILKPEIEVVLSAESFTGNPSYEGFNYNYSGTSVAATAGATGLADKKYIWQARVKDQENFTSDWKTMGGSPFDFGVDIFPPPSVEVFWAAASPETTPTYVYFTWEAVTDPASGAVGYNLYRTTTPGSGYAKIQSLITGTNTTDTTVVLGTDYYYVLRAEDQAGGESDNSREESAPYIILTREAVVSAPVGGGYSGSATDAVPGATIRYLMYFSNRGFALSTNIVIISRIPQHTEFKVGTATGEAISAVQYSNDNGSTFTYTPSGTYVDSTVTHIKWLCNDISSNISNMAEYSAVIR